MVCYERLKDSSLEANDCKYHVTHWEIKVFLRFSGELVSFRKLGQPDIYILL